MSEKSSRVWFVAAGTGGHIFPGLTLADELKKQNPEFDFLFFGTSDRLESKIVPSKGYPIQFLKSGQMKGSSWIRKFLISPLLMLLGMVQVFIELRKKRPLFVVSVGGYVSVPVGIVAALNRIPLFLLEPNIKAGASNILLSRFAKLAFTTPGSDALTKFKCQTFDYGNPIRAAIGPQKIAPQVKRILVLGGSQGALSLCRSTLKAFANLKLYENGIFLTLQSGEKNLDQSRQWRSEFEIDPYSTVTPFIHDISKELGQTDLVIARAGAMTVTELTESWLPTIFIPYPYAADDHQTQNARLLESSGAARVVLEKSQDFQSELESAIADLTLGPRQHFDRIALSQAIKKWSRPQAAAKISQEILSFLSNF
jgi:UDP-N-acetylglucosamine--N-acetylmuramyl-(pentapeptide) pyrophosphoryl-undecaprenol N-acetylglucosamine transferase